MEDILGEVSGIEHEHIHARGEVSVSVAVVSCRIPGCIKASEAKFDHLVEVVTTRSFYCEAMFLPLQMTGDLWGNTLISVQISGFLEAQQ